MRRTTGTIDEQISHDEKQLLMCNIETSDASAEHMTEAQQTVEMPCRDKQGCEIDGVAWDDVNDCTMDPVKVKQAREAGMSLFKRMRVFEKVPRQKCRDMAGREPIKVRGVDTKKQGEVNPKYRSILVAKDYKTKSEPELHTATPPIDALRLLLSLAATGYTPRGARRRIMINDVARPYFDAPSLSPTFVEIYGEDFEEGGEDRCGELRVSMYGTRPAAHNGKKCYTELPEKAGFKVTRASICIMRNDEKDKDSLVNGDDFVSVGDESELLWLQKVLEPKFETSTIVMGPGPDNSKEAQVLNRIITAIDRGFT